MSQFFICLAASTVSVGLSLFVFLQFQGKQEHLLWAIGLGASLLGYFSTRIVMKTIANLMLHKNIFGMDINKKGTKAGEKKVPECVGFSSAIGFMFIGCAMSLILQKSLQLMHMSCLLTTLMTIVLGFADDMLDVRWKYKIVIPFVNVIPAIMAYSGSTSVYMPFPLSIVLGKHLQLGWLYFLYIILLGIYCTHTINIYAGINGLEVGQSIIAGCSLLVIIVLRYLQHPTQQAEYAATMLFIFLGVSLALLKDNAYPSKVFVGDTYCYFAGIVIAVTSMMSSTAVVVQWLLIPQLINFLYSLKQILSKDCPRHRLAIYLKEQDLLKGEPNHKNLLNLSLGILGPTHESSLCSKLLIFQVLTSLPALLYQYSFLY